MSRFKLLPEAITVDTREKGIDLAIELENKFLQGKLSRLAVDTETTGLVRPKDYAVIIAISDGEKRWAVYPDAHPYVTDIIENAEVELIMANAAYDMWMLANIGIDVHRNCERKQYRVHDVQVMHHLYRDLDPHGLKWLAKVFLGIEMIDFSEVFDLSHYPGMTYADLMVLPEHRLQTTNYASLDAYVTFHLFDIFKKLLLDMPIDLQRSPMWVSAMEAGAVSFGKSVTMWDYYEVSELPFTRVLYECEREGMPVDVPTLLAEHPIQEGVIVNVERWFAKESHDMFLRLSADDDMRAFFYGKLGYTHEKVTDSGLPSVDEEVLKDWIKEHDCDYCRKYLEHKKASKYLSTYVVGLLRWAVPTVSGYKIFPSFRQIGARTGRLSSADPNLQNQPPDIRKVFLAINGWLFCSPDYSQLEMRVLAHLSGDQNLIDIITRGDDIHAATGAMMFNLPYQDIIAALDKEKQIDEANFAGVVTDLQLTPYDKQCLKSRKAAKAINFGLLYGQGPAKLAKTLGISKDEAKRYIKAYFAQFPSVEAYFEDAQNFTRLNGYSVTLMGRRRQLPHAHSYLAGDIASSERQTKNAPIQGTAADLVKWGMIRIWEDDYLADKMVKMCGQVHDEVPTLIPETLAGDELFVTTLTGLMCQPLYEPLKVPLAVSMKYGHTWMDCK